MTHQTFALISQGCLNEEISFRNGVQKSVFVVLKSHPYVLVVASSFDLNQHALTAKLVYDFRDQAKQKEVPFVKAPPLDFKVHCDKYGKRATVEVRLNVLTSQHEDSLFRVMVQAAGATTSQQRCQTIFSHPIRVVSKRNHKPLTKKAKHVHESSTFSDSNNNVHTKRTKNNSASTGSNMAAVSTATSTAATSTTLSPAPSTSSQNGEFEFMFHKLIKCYSSLPAHQRTFQVRDALLRVTSEASDHEHLDTTKLSLSEFVNVLSSESSSCAHLQQPQQQQQEQHQSPVGSDMNLMSLSGDIFNSALASENLFSDSTSSWNSFDPEWPEIVNSTCTTLSETASTLC